MTTQERIRNQIAIDVSDSDIEQLRQEAGTAGDSAQVDLCDRALFGDAEARLRCTQAIAEARASDVD